ncbi:MAG: ATPase, T2SS/T4P/T4SS family [Anaerolineae bacterium]|jgi:pilus assembly protein CpaF
MSPVQRYDYNELVKSVQDYCVKREIPVPRWKREVNQEEELAFHANVLRAMKDLGFEVAEEDRQAVAREVANRITGMGVLQPYLEQEGIEEIIVRRGFVQVERDGQIHDVGELAPDIYFYRLTRRIADLEGKEIGAEDPQIKLGLPDGSRFTAAIPPLSRQGTAINIRRFSRKKLTFEDLIDRHALDEEAADFLKDVARDMDKSVIFSGRPGSGKTTMLNAFTQYLPRHCQLSLVETFQEVQPQLAHFNHLVVEEGLGEVGRVVNVVFLRMRPDVMIIGEIVSEEAIEFIMGLNLGITAYSTTHAHSAELAMTRIETLSRGSGIPLEERREIIGSGLGIAIHIHKGYDPDTQSYRRFMREIIAISGVRRTGDGVQYELEVIKEYDPRRSTWTPLREPKGWRTL